MNKLIIILLLSIFFTFCERPEPVQPERGDCPAGSLMVGKNCVVSVGTACEGSDDCIGGFCVSNYNEKYCSQRCSEDYDCPLGYFCSRTGADKLCVNQSIRPRYVHMKVSVSPVDCVLPICVNYLPSVLLLSVQVILSVGVVESVKMVSV